MEKRFMTKVDIVAGYLGAGKTTFIKKLLAQKLQHERIIIFVNEYGEETIDKTFLNSIKNQVTQTELMGGCICCAGSGDFSASMTDLIAWESPDRVIIEPAGTAKLSDVLKILEKVVNMGRYSKDEIILNTPYVLVNMKKVKSYLRNFGEFYENQIQNAGVIIMTHTTGVAAEAKEAALLKLKELNNSAVYVENDNFGIEIA